MKRNRRKLKARAARWKASKDDTSDSAMMKRISGETLGKWLGKGQAPVVGVLH